MIKRSICLWIAACFVIVLTGCSKNNTDIKAYVSFAEENGIMPLENELGEYRDLYTLCHHGTTIPFEWDAYTLVAEYYIGSYEEQKEIILAGYEFEGANSIVDKTGESIKTEFFTDGYRFRMLSDDEYCGGEDDEFPERFYLIGVNDERKRIAFIYFVDPDLDCIEDFPQFLSADCGWELMKNK